MTTKVCVALKMVLLALLLAAIPQAWAQESAEKNAAEKTARDQKPADKSKAETSLAEIPMDFPQVQGPVELRPARGTRITLKLADTSRAIYEAIGRQAKISVIFDPDYIPRPISVELNGVSLEDALKIVAFESRTFWRPVTSDCIFVAADTQAKRREFEQQVVKTFYFPNISSPVDLQDIVNGLRTIVEVQRIQQMPFFRTVTLRATPEQMALTEKLIEDINRAKQKTAGQYRLEYKINEFNDDKKLSARTYMQLVEPREISRLRIGPRVPIQTGDKEKTYVDVGRNIDSEVRFETERSISLHLTVEFSELGSDERGTPESARGNPLIQQLRMETSATLELGTPTVVGSFQDPVSKHSFQIEATAVRTKSRE